jgi:hypothetical protein
MQRDDKQNRVKESKDSGTASALVSVLSVVCQSASRAEQNRGKLHGHHEHETYSKLLHTRMPQQQACQNN